VCVHMRVRSYARVLYRACCIILYIRNAYARARRLLHGLSRSISSSLFPSRYPSRPPIARAQRCEKQRGGGAEIGEEVEERERKTSERERARARVGKQRERAEERWCVSA